MLALSRKLNESVEIEGVGTVMVLGFRRGKVRLGFQIDPARAVHRSEVMEKVRKQQAEQEAAADETTKPLV